MNRIIALTLSVTALLTSCSGPKDELDTKIESGFSDQKLDAREAAELRQFITDNGDKLADEKATASLSEGGDAALLAYLKRSKAYRDIRNETGKPPVIELEGSAGQSLELKLYLEASGSMFPYDAPGSSGDFKRTLNQVINGFEAVTPDKTELFVVNTEVNPLGLSQSQFTKAQNIFNVAKTKGKTTSTDFELIFSQILKQTGGSDISVLASDLIYSDPTLRGQSVDKTLNAAEALMTTVFGNYANTHSMLVVKLTSDFDGPYYPAAGGTVRHRGERPYYLCFIGQNAAMQQFMQDEKYATLRDFRDLPGYDDFWFFTRNKAATEPYFSVLLNDPGKKGRFARADRDEKGIHTLEDVEAAPDKSLRIPVAVDLSKLNLPESFMTDKTQFEIAGKDNFKVEKVEVYRGGGATHKIWLLASKPARGTRTAVIRLKRDFPPRWVAETSTRNDARPDAESTFGLQNLLQGVESAYNASGQEQFFALTLTLKD
ncbi:hypothetical protein [Tellurirhabdus rosea]|uniref:hypothetical protein n=1 Tax=Tellurirhabdus rosea TaxID=2674997 RepID=UPI002256C171|nr:hypothetical protein [Tellurirhabdus rosea]